MSAGTELRLHDQVLDPHKAIDRNLAQDPKGLKAQKVKDSRNLYLVKEGGKYIENILLLFNIIRSYFKHLFFNICSDIGR